MLKRFRAKKNLGKKVNELMSRKRVQNSSYVSFQHFVFVLFHIRGELKADYFMTYLIVIAVLDWRTQIRLN